MEIISEFIRLILLPIIVGGILLALEYFVLSRIPRGDERKPIKPSFSIRILSISVVAILIGSFMGSLLGWVVFPPVSDSLSPEKLRLDILTGYIDNLSFVYHRDRVPRDRIIGYLQEWPAARTSLCKVANNEPDPTVTKEIVDLASELDKRGCDDYWTMSTQTSSESELPVVVIVLILLASFLHLFMSQIRPITVFILVMLLGILAGVFVSYAILPVEWNDVSPEALSEFHQRQIVQILADRYAIENDLEVVNSNVSFWFNARISKEFVCNMVDTTVNPMQRDNLKNIVEFIDNYDNTTQCP